MSSKTPELCYNVYMPDDSLAVCYPVCLAEDAKVVDLENAVRASDWWGHKVKGETISLFKYGESERPKKTRLARVLDWLRQNFESEDVQMEPSHHLQKYFPSGPAPEVDEKIDIIITTRFNLERKRPRLSDSSESQDTSVQRKLGEIAQLNGPVGKVEDQIAFILYTFLWGKAQNWKELVDTVEEDVPELQETNPYGAELTSELVRRKASFLDLTKIPGWPNDKSRISFKTTRFLIRQEYEELDSYLDKNHEDHVILIGHPGIGKTVYLTHCLLKRLASGKPTFLVLKPDVRYLFQESGVYWAPENSFVLSRQGIINEGDPNCRTLFDLNVEQKEPVGLGTWPALVASSPQESRYKHFRKENLPNVQDFIMKTWEWTELYMSREMAVNKRTLEEWRCAYQKYGGSARKLLTAEAYRLEHDIAIAIWRCDKLDLLLRPMLHDYKDDVSHALVEINPLVEESGEIVRDIPTGRIISQYIFAKILKEKKDALVSQMENVFQGLFDSKWTQSAAGILFEGGGHVYVFKSRNSPIPLRSLGRPTEFTSLDLSSINEIFNFTSRLFPTLDHNHYYRPLSGTLPGIDSFALEVDSDTHDACIVLFQFTIGDHHPTNPTFLYTLWEKRTKENGLYKRTRNRKWKLVFVVPDTIAVSFRKQPWSPASEEEIWDRRIDQYVFGVPYAKLWAAMREWCRELANTSIPSS